MFYLRCLGLSSLSVFHMKLLVKIWRKLFCFYLSCCIWRSGKTITQLTEIHKLRDNIARFHEKWNVANSLPKWKLSIQKFLFLKLQKLFSDHCNFFLPETDELNQFTHYFFEKFSSAYRDVQFFLFKLAS